MYWKTIYLVLATVICLTPNLSAQPRNVPHPQEPVIIQAKDLPEFSGKEISHLRVHSYINGELTPIPFQVDERKANGEYLLTQGPDPKTPDLKFNGIDELVVMAGDLGDKAPKEDHPKADIMRELNIRDSSGQGGWIYISFYTGSNAPPLSKTDYVKYDHAKSLIEARDYSYGYHKKMSFKAVTTIIKKEAGGKGIDIMDGFKLRAKVIVKGGKIKFNRDERDIKSKVLAWNDGQVRVIRRSSIRVKSIGGLYTSPEMIYLDMVHYCDSFKYLMWSTIPFDISKFFQNILVSAYLDFNDFRGQKIYHQKDLKPLVKVDGKMDPNEEALNKVDADWMVLVGPHGSFIARTVYNHKLPTSKSIYYRDDQAFSDPPEDYPGQLPGIGYTIYNMHKLKKGKHSLGVEIYSLKPNEIGHEKEFIDKLDRPYKIVQ